MNANYAEISRVGNLEADFQQVPLVQLLTFFYNNLFSGQKSKRHFLRQKKKIQNITLLQKVHRSDQILAQNLILGEIFENKTRKQKRQIVSFKLQRQAKKRLSE